MRLMLIWILNALALLAVAYLLPDIHVDGKGFEVNGFWAGVMGALLYSAFSFLFSQLLRQNVSQLDR
ncbi:MAG: hypothetical protein K8R50_10310 [Betaproteobacteria bacterium]|nr:hypothetical protein [Betaproteobacteria bacterium]